MKILTAPADLARLTTYCEEIPVIMIPRDITTAIKHMTRLMIARKGIGLAAPQVGLNQRFFVAAIRGEPRAYINPRILSTGGRRVRSVEGCLSLPGRQFAVARASSIKVEYFDAQGNRHGQALSGLDAIVFQHERDHLDGILISMRGKEVGAA